MRALLLLLLAVDGGTQAESFIFDHSFIVASDMAIMMPCDREVGIVIVGGECKHTRHVLVQWGSKACIRKLVFCEATDGGS